MSVWHSPLVVAVTVASLSFVSNTVLTLINQNAQRKIESMKIKKDIIVSSLVKNNDLETRKNIEFYLSSGILEDDNGKIKKSLGSGLIIREINIPIAVPCANPDDWPTPPKIEKPLPNDPVAALAVAVGVVADFSVYSAKLEAMKPICTRQLEFEP